MYSVRYSIINTCGEVSSSHDHYVVLDDFSCYLYLFIYQSMTNWDQKHNKDSL